MMGNESDRGIIPRINDFLFESVDNKLKRLAELPDEGETKFMITVRSSRFVESLKFT